MKLLKRRKPYLACGVACSTWEQRRPWCRGPGSWETRTGKRLSSRFSVDELAMLQGHVNIAIFVQNHLINWLAPYLPVNVIPLLEMSKLFKYQKQTVEDASVRKGWHLPRIKGRRMAVESMRCYQRRSRVFLSAPMPSPSWLTSAHSECGGRWERMSTHRKCPQFEP